MPKTVAELLVQYQKDQKELQEFLGDAYNNYNLVIALENGNPVESRIVRDRFQKLCEQNGYEKVVFHSLRHLSTGYKLKMTNGDVKSVQGDTGHAEAEMVTDVYSEIIDEDRRYNAQKMDEQFYSTLNHDSEMQPQNEEVQPENNGLSDSDMELLQLLKSLSLAAYHPELPARLRILHPGELSILQVRRQEDYSQLILSSMSFVVLNKPLTVVSMKNIRSVLENKETEAWQKLIRVLTHEIMNSMTPIVSLSELLKSKQTSEPITDEEREEIHQAVDTIFRRSSGLVRFVENYRKVTGIPTPVPEIILVDSLLDNVALLFREETDSIKVLPSASHLQVIADKALIEQILINLIKNALDATQECENPRIELSAGINAEGKNYIQVSDNGTGIPADVQERIFIPFFTTKPVGSGIGLSISRQIMYMHKGSLTVISEAGKGSRFLLTFA